MKIVYHANYLSWFEVGRTEYIRESGYSYRDIEEKGFMLPLTNASLIFHSPALYDDEIEVRTSIENLSPVRLDFYYEIYRVAEQKLLVSGKTEHVFTNMELKPIRLSKMFPELYSCLQKEYESR
ncbi:acyl-CoA thioesterase [Brevibacillus daliensis]|uniref:acyl-CoA thioesterase n=1 Tax=Brevibacillus daliensis TaxID=2892995 RepID=UPI001E2EFB4B